MMPIQFPDFQRITFDQANPWLVGAERGQNFAQSAMQFPQDLRAKILANQIAAVNAKYAEPNAQAALTTAQQHNIFDPRIWNSEIGLRGAQAGLMGQQSKYYGQNIESEIALRNAQAQQAQATAQQNQIKLNFLKSRLSNHNNPGNVNQPSSNNVDYSGDSHAATSAQIDSSHNPVAQSQPQNEVYGISTPQLDDNDIVNKMVFGVDTFTPKLQNATTQQQDQYNQYQKTIAKSIKDANAANSLKQAISVFNNAMDKSFYKGSRFGHLPSSGFFSPPGNLAPEQTSDRAALQMLPSAIETFKDAMGTARFSNLDMNMSSKMKFDRTMDDETRATQSQWINGVSDRMIEESKFYSLLGQPNSGLKRTEADLLWSAYQQDFPLISSDGKTYQGSNLGNWPLYTTPKAIASIKATGTYSPSKKEKNVFMMNVPNGKGDYVMMPIKKGKVESAFRKGAKPL